MTKLEFKHIRPLQPNQQQESEDSLAKRFVKHDLHGNELPFSATQWATITDKVARLMWANSWNADDTFPVTKVTWFANDDFYCQEHYEQTWNNGYNTENWLATINHHSWAGYQDWRMPTMEELATLLLKKRVAGKIEFDIQRYNQLFSEIDENKFFWSGMSYDEYSQYALGVYFFNGHESNVNKTSSYHMRVVRSI